MQETWTCQKEQTGKPVAGRSKNICRCAFAAKQYVESRGHMVGECEIYKEERDVLKEKIRKIDECGMDEFSTLIH